MQRVPAMTNQFLTGTPSPRRALRRSVLVLGFPLALSLTACAGGGAAGPVAAGPEGEARGVPGFDTRDYPGDDVMTRWRAESPYRWVGFYLSAPCYTGTSWQGKRSALRRMGWGLAVLFVGEQDWPESHAAAPEDAGADPAPGAEGPRCTRGNLSGERGRADGAAAADAASAEGFAPGTVVYLDVEPVEAVSDSLAAYVMGWTEALVGGGYAPGLYAHARNAETLLARMAAATGTGANGPRLWVARPGGFTLRRGPTESGFPATIWQGDLDTIESWGGTSLRIDRNVADRADPSG